MQLPERALIRNQEKHAEAEFIGGILHDILCDDAPVDSNLCHIAYEFAALTKILYAEQIEAAKNKAKKYLSDDRAIEQKYKILARNESLSIISFVYGVATPWCLLAGVKGLPYMISLWAAGVILYAAINSYFYHRDLRRQRNGQLSSKINISP